MAIRLSPTITVPSPVADDIHASHNVRLREAAGRFIPLNLTQRLHCGADDLLSCRVTFQAAPADAGPMETVRDYDIYFTREGQGRVNGYGRHFYHRQWEGLAVVCTRTVRGRDTQPAVPPFLHRDIEPEWDVVGLNALQGASFSVFYHLFSILLLAIQRYSSPRSGLLSKPPVTRTYTIHTSSTPIAATCIRLRKMQPVSRIHS